MSALELRDVVVDYERRGGGRVRAVAGASLSVERGQIVGLVGESGCGKSTLARAAVGLVPISGGSVVFEGEPVTPLTRRARPQSLARLQLVFQNPYSSLNPRRKVGSQLADALAARLRARRERPRVRRALRARRPLRDRGQPLPARVLRRPAPADRDRPHARRRPVGDRPRRAARLARRLGAGAAREPARRPLARPRARAAADLARPRDRPPRRRHRLRHVPRERWSRPARRCRSGRCRCIPTARR